MRPLLQQLLLVQLSLAYQIDWCLYFRLRKIYKPECKYYDITRERPEIRKIVEKIPGNTFRMVAPIPQSINRPAVNRVIEADKPRSFSSLLPRPPTCSAYRKYCTNSGSCSNGETRCLDMTSFRECCAPTERQCPPPSSLGFSCVVARPTNWCEMDAHCSSSPYKKCCATGCNYNICL